MIVIAATQNQHKIKEIDAITAAYGFEIKDLGYAGLADLEVVEDGDTFSANSLKKAMEVHKACGQITLADDSGLAVDALDGAPGVYSARFAGEDANDEKNNEKLLQLLESVPEEKRTARFVSVITMVFPGGEALSARGECEGTILRKAAGANGFGYDPLFVPVGFQKSFAELTPEEKNQISHRANALKVLETMLAAKQR